MKSKFAYLLALAIALSSICCKDQNKNPVDTEQTKTNVSFESFNPRSITVKNNTGERLIAFKGEIGLNSLISGVPAYASNHGLKMDDNLFQETGDFPLLFLTEEVFNKNKGNLAKVKNNPFASVYAFWSKTVKNNSVIEVSSKIGGAHTFTLHNSSPFNAEIRLNSKNGEVLCYVPAYTMNTTVNLDPATYVFYPVFKKYIPLYKEIYPVFPVFNRTKEPFFNVVPIADSMRSWDVGDIWDPSSMHLSTGGFYLIVNNQAKMGVQFKQGDLAFVTSRNIDGISSGEQQMFFVPFPKKPGGHSYPDKMKMSTLSIGFAKHACTLPEFEYELDHHYTVVVKGQQADDLHLEPLEDLGKVNIEELFGL